MYSCLSAPTMPAVHSLRDLCSYLILDNVQLLKQEGRHVEKAIQVLASKHLNANILAIVGHNNWIKSLSFKASTLTDEGLSRISGMHYTYSSST
jgi:hypothetical protein